jgi:UDP-N-acetylmuramoyl-tripeptide--D-alanyl-D-alanine ligase
VGGVPDPRVGSEPDSRTILTNEAVAEGPIPTPGPIPECHTMMGPRGVISYLRFSLRARKYIPRGKSFPQLKYFIRVVTSTPLFPAGSFQRARLDSTGFIAVTGSAGKTTAKNLIHAALSACHPTVAGRGTRNRGSEMLFTLMRTTRRHRFCVQEIGAFAPGSLEGLVALFQPTIGVVTNVAAEHFAAFRSLDAVAAEKSTLVSSLPPQGAAILNFDDPLVRAMAGVTRARVVSFGLEPGAAVRGEKVESCWPVPLRFSLAYRGRRYPVQTRLHGEFWVHSCLAALATAAAAGVDLERAALALAHVEPEAGRMSPVELPNGAVLIRDDWKSPAWSVPHALRFLEKARASQKVLVLGRISDSSVKPRRLYRRITRQTLEVADRVLAVGRWASHVEAAGGDDERAKAFPDSRALASDLAASLGPGDLVLVKTTRGAYQLDRLVPTLLGALGADPR